MKLRKALVAKVLAAAVAITSVLPMGAMTANAAPTVRVEKDEVKWMYADAEGNFTMKPERWIDSKTGKQTTIFGDNLIVGDAMASWGFQALNTDGSAHGDLTDSNAATTIYASKIDIKSRGVRRVMQFDMVKLTDAGTQFGVMLKYVDANNWVYLGYNGSNEWYVEWRNGATGGYCNGGGTISRDYYDGDGVHHDSWDPQFQSVSIATNKYLRIKVTYENMKQIRVRMAELERVKDGDGSWVLEEKAGTAKEDVLSFKAFKDIRTYSETGDKPIHFGFIGDKRTDAVKVNFMNVMDGALQEKSATSQEPDQWVEALEPLSFPECGWASPKASEDQIENIIKEQRIGDGVTYASIGDPKRENKKAPNVTIYNNTITDFSEGTIKADLRPYGVGNGKEFYLGVLDPDMVSSVSPSTPDSPKSSEEGKIGSFNIGINNDKWVYNVDGKETVISGDNLPAITEKTDYSVRAVIDQDGNVIADVTTKKDTADAKTVSLITANDNVNVKGLSGSVSLTAKNEVLRAKHVTCTQMAYEKTPLEETYDEIVAANAHNEFYTDVWGEFNATPQGALGQAWSMLNGEYKDTVFSQTPQGAGNWNVYDESFDEGAAAALQTAFDAINVSSNKVAAGKASLQTEFDKAISPESPDAKKWYTAESLATYAITWNAVNEFLAGLVLDDDFEGVTKKAVTDKESEITEAVNALVPNGADETYINENLVPAITTALDGIDDIEDENNVKYYNNWEEFKEAVEKAEDLKTKENPTIEEVDKAIRALEGAKANLTLKTVTSLTEYTSQIEEMSGDTITEEYYKGDFAAYTTALEAARGIKVGDTVKDADAKMNVLKAAFAGISLKTLADDTEKANELKSEVSAVKAEVAAKKYVKDEKWAEYETALAEVEGMLANAESTILDVVNAVAALKDAKDALTVDTTPDQKPDPTPDNKPAPPQPEVKDPAVGTPYTDAATGMKYKVGANQTVELTEGNKSSKKVTVNAVTIEGKSYKVTSIATNAFKGAKMTTLTIGDNVTTINKNAFNNCKALKTVTIGKNVKSIKANAFGKCKKINSVTFKGTKKLPTIKNAFKGANTKPKTIKVKKALIKKASQKTKVLKQLKAAGFKKITAKNIKGVK